VAEAPDDVTAQQAAYPPSDKAPWYHAPTNHARTTAKAAQPPPCTSQMSLRPLSFPTPKSVKLYPSTHRNARYKVLNSLNLDFMNREPGPKGAQSQQNMQGLLRDVFNFNTANNEKNEFQSYTGEFTYHIAKVPLAEDEDDFYIKAKSTKWLEGILENSLKDGDIGTAIKCMINYLVTLLLT